MITLKEITRDNFWDCISLEVVPEQVDFVTSNAVSIAQSKVQPECIPMAVYDDDLMVGFVMYCIDEDDSEFWIYRMMIDKNHQSKGYGKKANQKELSKKAGVNYTKIVQAIEKENSIFKVVDRSNFFFS